MDTCEDYVYRLGPQLFAQTLACPKHELDEIVVVFGLSFERHGGRWKKWNFVWVRGSENEKCNAKSHFGWNQYVSATEKYILFWSEYPFCLHNLNEYLCTRRLRAKYHPGGIFAIMYRYHTWYV
jgi:hypothetical protein